jgi:signal transduction histidine kinase
MSNQNNITKLKKSLNLELQKEVSDNDEIIKLSQQIANLDQSRVRFSIDAGVIDRLGKELVARQETAVSELVKNSYDADATEVYLTFFDTDRKGGTLQIDDNGEGMNREELINGFMRISSTGKIHNPVSKEYNRTRAGKKGIGRFAVQRLGKRLSIITQKKDLDFGLKLSIDWDDYKQDINLLSISNTLEIIPKEKENGTTLIIEDLRDKWSVASIKRIYRYVADIIQPYSLTETKEKDDNDRIRETQDPGFVTIFSNSVNGIKTKIADEKTEIFKYSVAKIEGWIDSKGQGLYTIESDRLGIDEIGNIGINPDDEKTPFDKLNQIKFRAYYFLIDTEFIPKMHFGNVRKFLKSQGSVRLYRNGFRVLPYGETGDDWLKLDASLRTRSILPSHGNNNFYGLVEMLDKDDKFVETSSREGLADSEELRQLQNFIYRVLLTGVIKVAEVRNIKITTSQQKDDDGNWESTDLRIKNIFKTIEELDQELEDDTVVNRKKRKRRVKRIKEDLQELQKIQASEKNKMIKERAMLRVLSSVGLSIAQFIHEIKYYMVSIRSDIDFLTENLKSDSAALERTLILKSNFSTFHTYTAYFDDVISKNISIELEPLNMEEVVEDFTRSIKLEAERSGVKFLESEVPIYRVFSKPMHRSEWASILFNFYTNSKKAIKRANSDGEILIEIGEEEKMIFLEFSDNGDGISKEIEDKIFDEFFTTTSSKSFESLETATEILGTGLGLKIVKDIIKSYRGNISVVSPKDDFSTTIRVEIPKATEKEKNEYGI